MTGFILPKISVSNKMFAIFAQIPHEAIKSINIFANSSHSSERDRRYWNETIIYCAYTNYGGAARARICDPYLTARHRFVMLMPVRPVWRAFVFWWVLNAPKLDGVIVSRIKTEAFFLADLFLLKFDVGWRAVSLFSFLENYGLPKSIGMLLGITFNYLLMKCLNMVQKLASFCQILAFRCWILTIAVYCITLQVCHHSSIHKYFTKPCIA